MYELDMSIQQSEDNVVEAMLLCLNKAEEIVEYAGIGDASDSYVMELFDIFMEATDRRKKADEIDEYMRKHNWGDVNAKSPAQAKKARQVRNFLIMQDFDPKTGTVKSSDGQRRVKFNFNGKSSAFSHHIDPDNDSLNKIEVNGRRNSSKINKDINFALNHEKGHEQFRADGRSKRWNDKNTPEDKSERGIKHIDEAKAKGKHINSHDDGTYLTGKQTFLGPIPGDKQSPEELEADLHAAKTARVRTKYAGRKRAVKRSGATRELTRKEICKIYNNMEKIIYFSFFSNKEPTNSTHDSYEVTEQKSAIVALRKVTKNINKFNKIINNIKFRKIDDNSYEVTIDPDMKQMYELLNGIACDLPGSDKISGSVFIDYKYCLKKIDRHLRYIEEMKSKLEQLPDDEEFLKDFYQKELIEYEDDLKTAQSELNEIISKYPNIENDIGVIRHIFVEGIKGLFFSIKYNNPEWNQTFQVSEYKVNHMIDDINDIKKRLSNPEKYKNIIDAYIKGFASIETLDKSKNDFKKKLQKWHQSEGGNVKMDDSTKMRYRFVKKYVHEYFVEFMEDYFSYENVFLCDD